VRIGEFLEAVRLPRALQSKIPVIGLVHSRTGAGYRMAVTRKSNRGERYESGQQAASSFGVITGPARSAATR